MRNLHVIPLLDLCKPVLCSHTLLQGVNEILPIFSSLFIQVGKNSVQEMVQKTLMESVMSFVKIGIVKAVLYLWV
jgi:hypothetical protein